VASPSDIKEERERLERIVTELNRTWADTLALEIELVRWETHAYPGFNTDPQAAINEEISDDYEIFIGLLWARVGTPTPRALSGTLEEFERAYTKFKANPESVNLLIYFKDQPIPPSEIKPDQVDQIQRFRNSLGSLGGLYWTFQTCGDFEALVRPHLARVIQVWNGRIDSQSSRAHGAPQLAQSVGPQKSEISQSDDGTEIDELGYLDYMEIGEHANVVMVAALARMTSAMEDLGAKLRERTAVADNLTKSPNLTAAKGVANDAATDLEDFAKRIAAEVPVFAEAYADVLRAFSGAASIAVEERGGQDQVENALKQVEQLRAALEGSKGQLIDFAGNLRSTPRLTTHLNRARHKALKVIASLDAEFGKVRSNSIMVEASIRDLVKPKSV
jgi:hypothetical protein